jgi:hypothetical protein
MEMANAAEMQTVEAADENSRLTALLRTNAQENLIHHVR